MADGLEIRRKRLLYQAQHRGTQESDLVIGGFAEAHLGGFGASELDEFEALIGGTDADLMDWVSGRAEAPERLRGRVLDLLISFKNDLITN